MIYLAYLYTIAFAATRIAQSIWSCFALRSFLNKVEIFNTETKNDMSLNGTLPGISIITSIRGLGMPLEEGLTSLVTQKYSGPVELIVAIENSDDPALEVSKKILAPYEKGNVSIKWVTNFKAPGGNPRNRKMAFAANLASHDWIYWSAADTILPQDHLKKLYKTTQNNKNIYVSSIPIQFGGGSLGAILETIIFVWEIPAFFFVNIKLKQPQVYGGSIFYSKDLIQKSGGYSSILDYLTEEVPFIKAFSKVGGINRIVEGFVWVRQQKQPFSDFYRRKLRWLTIAKIHHTQFFYYGLVFNALTMLFVCMLSGLSLAYITLGIYLFVHMLTSIYYHTKLNLPFKQWKHCYLILIYEMIYGILSIHTFAVKKINWAGDWMKIENGGKIVRIEDPTL